MQISTKPSINLLALSYGWNKTKLLDKYKQKGHFSLFLLEAMSRSQLPAFTYRGRKHPLQKSRTWYGPFDRDLKKVYSTYHSEILVGLKNVRYKEISTFPKQFNNLIKSLGPYSPPFTKVILSPNLFGVPGEGYGPLIGQTAFAVFTPNPNKDQTWLMVHEVCHSLLLPIFHSATIKKLIKQTEPLMEKWSTKKFRRYYPKWEWMIEEYFIHTIEQYVTNSSIKEKMSWGMKRLPWFVTSWATFQKRREAEPSINVEHWIRATLQEMKLTNLFATQDRNP
jgi:hypothetical protein